MTKPIETAEVIAVGSELLGSTRLDTNSLFISGTLARCGIELKAKAVVGDDRHRIRRIFEQSIERADLVILCGGLGPTDDDLTREAVADALERLGLLPNPDVIPVVGEEAGRRDHQNRVRQDQIPTNCRL